MDTSKRKYIDHTILKPETSKKAIAKLCQEAIEYNFKTICIASSWVKYASQKLANSKIGITSVVGFPHGTMATQAKVFEAKLAVDHGASEIDMVIQIGRLKDGEVDYILNEINKVKQVIGSKILKVIIETALLSEHEIKLATEIVKKSNADFIKTSTGFSYRGASPRDLEIFNEILDGKKAIKAAGGIKTLADLDNMIKLGATRIGTSSSIALVKNQKVKNDY